MRPTERRRSLTFRSKPTLITSKQCGPLIRGGGSRRLRSARLRIKEIRGSGSRRLRSAWLGIKEPSSGTLASHFPHSPHSSPPLLLTHSGLDDAWQRSPAQAKPRAAMMARLTGTRVTKSRAAPSRGASVVPWLLALVRKVVTTAARVALCRPQPCWVLSPADACDKVTRSSVEWSRHGAPMAGLWCVRQRWRSAAVRWRSDDDDQSSWRRNRTRVPHVADLMLHGWIRSRRVHVRISCT